MAPTATTRRPFTLADRERFPDDGNRYELLDGDVLVTPAPASRHQHVLQAVGRLFEDVGAYVLQAPVDIVLAQDTVLQPDVCVWSEPFDHDQPVPIPDLVVEVSSPSTWRRDLSLKRDRYAAEGIREYWFVDMQERRILVHHLTEGTTSYEVTTHAEEDPATSHLFDLTTTLSDVTP